MVRVSVVGCDIDRSDRMVAAATEAGSPATAVVTWLGYDAPDDLVDAASESYADNGKGALAGFEDGLRATHQGVPSHNTVVGHSYGTTLVGHAARDRGRRGLARMHRWKPKLVQAVVLVVLLSANACGSNGAGMQPTITIDEANRRVDEYISRATTVLPPAARLQLNFQERRGECSDPTDNGPKDRVVAGRSYQVLGLRQAAIPSYFDTLRTWWLANNFRILSDTPRNEFLWVENNADGFQMTLKANSEGGVFLLAGSPCVWPNGTPEPEALGTQKSDTGTPVVSAEAESARARKPRRAPVEDEDFDQIDWIDRDLR